MTFTTDPPAVGDISLIPNADEKADLNAPAGSGGKLVIGQAPNITITETNVVADATERLALDVQEGDVAIQTNVSTSFIFTGGDNIATNWQTLDFDAVGAIDGEDITPSNVTASGDVSMQDLTVAGAINGADTSAAAAGEALTSDGTGGFNFAEVGGDTLSLMSDFLSQSNMAQIAPSQSAMQDVINTGLMQNVAVSQTAMQEVAASQIAMQEVINSAVPLNQVIESQTAMQEVAASQTAMQEIASSESAMQKIGLSQTAQTEIVNSNTATNVLNSQSTSFGFSEDARRDGDQREVIPQTDENYAVYINEANYTGYTGFGTSNEGWYDANNNFLGATINEVFVDTLKIGWNSTNGAFDIQTLSGNIDAVIF